MTETLDLIISMLTKRKTLFLVQLLFMEYFSSKDVGLIEGNGAVAMEQSP